MSELITQARSSPPDAKTTFLDAGIIHFPAYSGRPNARFAKFRRTGIFWRQGRRDAH